MCLASAAGARKKRRERERLLRKFTSPSKSSAYRGTGIAAQPKHGSAALGGEPTVAA